MNKEYIFMLRWHYSAIKESEQPVWMMLQSFCGCPNVHYMNNSQVKRTSYLHV